MKKEIKTALSEEQDTFIEWISNNQKIILYGIIGLIAILFVTMKFASSSSIQAENDYFNIEKQVSHLFNATKEQNPPAQRLALEHIETILARRPDLRSKYDGMIAQMLLLDGSFTEAKPFAIEAIKRTEHLLLPHYTDYTKTTLLIAQKEYESALAKAFALKEVMLQEAQKDSSPRSFGDALFAYNLLRIAMLEQELGHQKEEYTAWQEWKKFSNESGLSHAIAPKAFKELTLSLEDGNLSLSHYIEERENRLKR